MYVGGGNAAQVAVATSVHSYVVLGWGRAIQLFANKAVNGALASLPLELTISVVTPGIGPDQTIIASV